LPRPILAFAFGLMLAAAVAFVEKNNPAE